MRRLFLFLFAQAILLTTWAQAPQKIGYQAVVRNTSGTLVINKTVGLQISILSGSATGTSVYVETHTPTTNVNGLLSIEIGTGTIQSGVLSSIDWSKGPYFLKTETDPTGGTTYTITGVSQLISVPYALYAGSAPSMMPIYTQAEINTLVPTLGLEVYNSTTKTIDVWVGTEWRHSSTKGDCGSCGDGNLSDCEECDDGNSASGDGCTYGCTVESINEPNDTFGQATTIGATHSDNFVATFIGNDIDYYTFVLPAGKTISFTDASNSLTMISYNSAQSQIGSGTGQLSVVNSTALAQTYYLYLKALDQTKPFYIKMPYTVTP